MFFGAVGHYAHCWQSGGAGEAHSPSGSEQVDCSVEEVGYAVEEVVGFDSVKSASPMNSAVVIFLDKVHKVEQVVKVGIILRDTFTLVYPLLNPSKKDNFK